MTFYRRYYIPGGTYFFTLVTFQRRPILTETLGRRCLREAIQTIRKEWPFEIVALVLLPDHLHTIWTLPEGDARYSLRWQRIKEEFTRNYLQAGGLELAQTRSRQRQRYRGIWQKRFWEHTCDDDQDLKNCLDYCHWNPKKHGLVSEVRDWPWSSFHRWVRAGEYSFNWGNVDPTPGFDAPEWE